MSGRDRGVRRRAPVNIGARRLGDLGSGRNRVADDRLVRLPGEQLGNQFLIGWHARAFIGPVEHPGQGTRASMTSLPALTARAT